MHESIAESVAFHTGQEVIVIDTVHIVVVCVQQRVYVFSTHHPPSRCLLFETVNQTKSKSEPTHSARTVLPMYASSSVVSALCEKGYPEDR